VPLAELWARQYSAIIGEADEPAIERGVPECRQEKPVVHVEALLVVASPARGTTSSFAAVRVCSLKTE
jgi:hypothetical protein